MYKVGVFPGKFLPPHRGHLNSIINAATQCEKLYVVVSDHPEENSRLCEVSNLKPIDLKTRAKWLSIELQTFDHIKILMLDETGIPVFPEGWYEWSLLLNKTVPEPFDVIFGGEVAYEEKHKEYFPNIEYKIFDYKRERYPISATLIRQNPLEHWDYILGSARSHFAKRVLLTGTESCGKTTMTKYLGKIYHTSWTEEVGRYYSERELGGNEDVFTIHDFERIAYQQIIEDEYALKTCNRITFFDTDAVVTQYYLGQYLEGAYSESIDRLVDPSKYDVVLLFTPDVKWVPDGLRFLSNSDLRWKLHKQLKQMYLDRGFKIIEIDGDYHQRLQKTVEIVDSLLRY